MTGERAYPAMNRRRRAINSSDLHSLGGLVSVIDIRDRDGEPYFRIRHIGCGGSLVWLSERIGNEEHAVAGAETLAQFLGASMECRT